MSFYFNLGEMKSASGEALRYEAAKLSSILAIKLSQIIETQPLYQSLHKILNSPKTLVYFQKLIKEEIYPLVRDLCVIRWYRENNRFISSEDQIVLAPRSGIFVILDQVWPEDVALKYVKNKHSKEVFMARLRNLGKKTLDLWNQFFASKNGYKHLGADTCRIAVQYVEGLDVLRRSDIVWFPHSQIDPKRVLIYFNHLDYFTGEPISEEVIKTVESLGMSWVSLKPGIFSKKSVPVWYPARKDRKFQNSLRYRPKSTLERWLYSKAQQLLKKVDYWYAFHKAFNIKLHFIPGEEASENLLKIIAMDAEDLNGGFSIGKQRSDFSFPPPAILGDYSKDIFFIWGDQAKRYLPPEITKIRSGVISGYPNDFVFKDKEKIKEAYQLRQDLEAKGVRFLLALFDNVHSSSCHMSTEMMEKFYCALLEWLLTDSEIGIVIKSKKPSVLDRLPKVLPLLSRAEESGRCVRLKRYFGRLPIDAALGSDMAVGMGISSAVVESVIAGCRGILCDLTHLRSHEFYQWGYERIIFDNLDRMMTALKQCKTDKSVNPQLGDWTPFLDRLDPFRDGRAGERMGTYMRRLLEGYAAGLNREEILKKANANYVNEWGKENLCST